MYVLLFSFLLYKKIYGFLSCGFQAGGLGIRVMIKPEYQITPPTPSGDPVVEKYVSSGLARDAVAFAVLNYGDNPIKVSEFVKGYNMIREMGFTSKNVAEVLAMYDNDTDKALGHLLNNS
ncbi:Ubiquitin-associated 1 [Rhynchospora pubera]|uniref:Ubiquitin-associated 1 n=1 Tax=Rhynchospora pubera TaxID=906938 RepID=A0AAV8DJC0_9POAL|nr:Ubiquitin-associated 1 [Rhynchospora pubera]